MTGDELAGALRDTSAAVLALAAVPSERRTDMQVAELMEAAERLAGCVRAPGEITGYLVDGKVWHPSDVTIIRRQVTDL